MKIVSLKISGHFGLGRVIGYEVQGVVHVYEAYAGSRVKSHGPMASVDVSLKAGE